MNTGRTFQSLTGARAGFTPLNRQHGLSLIEILVTITLLVVIILGLTAMFNQTRKAFTVGLGNVDYQDAGRTAMDLITRDLEQMAPSDYSTYNYATYNGNPGTFSNGLNFSADVSPFFNTNIAWSMAGGDSTNFSIENLLFVTRYNQTWNAVGYRLVSIDSTTNTGPLFTGALYGVGTLYRYNVSGILLTNLAGFQLKDFRFDPPLPQINQGLSRVVDGVVDFRIRAYDRNGLLISGTNPPPYTLDGYINYNIGATNYFNGDIGYGFYSNAVPAYVEVELGIMESPTLAQLQALTNTPVAYTNFLTSHAGQVHIFRQRVTIPAVDSAAYP